jgi:hypothetical protein
VQYRLGLIGQGFGSLHEHPNRQLDFTQIGALSAGGFLGFGSVDLGIGSQEPNILAAYLLIEGHRDATFFDPKIRRVVFNPFGE